jgi:hypothetical protein
MLGRWITRWTILRPECALAGDAAVQLLADFFTASLLERISAATDEDRDDKCE